MYFPYLRGKQNEVLALRELAGHLGQGRRVLPVVEPVRPRQISNLVRVVDTGLPLIVVENPEKGNFKDDARLLREALAEPTSLGRDDVTVGYLVTTQTRKTDVEAFLRRNDTRRFAFVHLGSFGDPRWLASAGANYNILLTSGSGGTYREVFARKTRVLLRDAFQKRARNQDYPPREFFSDAHKRRSRGRDSPHLPDQLGRPMPRPRRAPPVEFSLALRTRHQEPGA